MSAPDLDAADLEATDKLMEQRFGCKPVDDISGLFTGRSSLAVAPAPTSETAAPTAPEFHQGPRAAAPSDDAQFEAYMAAFFPQAARR